ncbi:MAG: hypothetical protein ACP5JW_02345 [Candidatus Bathyarchaeia archaeon]
MKPLEVLYWLRFVLGIVAAFICVGYEQAVGLIGTDLNLTTLFNGIAFALIVYILSYYMIKPKFILKVEKPQKIFTTGMGIYFLSWLVFWVLFYTIALWFLRAI